MKHHPLYNAIVAELYISAVASVLYYGPKHAGPVNSIIVPIALLSLFVLSAAVMGYLFGYEPIRLYIEGKHTESTRFFLETIGWFALLTAVVLGLLLMN